MGATTMTKEKGVSSRRIEMVDARVEAAEQAPEAASGLESELLAPASDVFPEFAVSLEEANRRIGQFKEFVRDHMVEGEDYGVIPGASPKPTLFKPGAEKLNAIFGLAPMVEIVHRTEDWDAGFVSYEIKVTLLNKRSGAIEAEGIGSCNSRERRYKNQDAANVANTLLKMAKKRALIDATLSATRASGMFTQDLEDIEIGGFDRGNRNAERSDRPSEREETRSMQSGFQPASRARAEREESERDGGAGGNDPNILTEAQNGAILAIANKVFGRNAKEELAKLSDRPIAQLSRAEASRLIDRLRTL